MSSQVNLKMDEENLKKFKKSMTHVYGGFESLTEDSAKTWNPSALAEGHRGRYLWTDGFAVVNFLTLYKETQDKKYLVCATRLVETVHGVLGFTRDGKSRLHPATEAEPLLGGLRIGKLEADGEDGDGQYFHYLTIWMFALVQAGNATGDPGFTQQAGSLAKAIHPKFMYKRNSDRPRMYWKMSMDLKEPLVLSEGNLDPIDGYVVYSLVQRSLGDSSQIDLKSEIQDYEKILNSKYSGYSSSDTLDLGMTLWTTHWFTGEVKAEWATVLTNSAMKCLDNVAKNKKHFDRPLSRRLAFREFGTVLGIKSHPESSSQFIKSLGEQIIQSWEQFGAVPVPSPMGNVNVSERLQPITLVMYATALFPGAFLKDYWNKSS